MSHVVDFTLTTLADELDGRSLLLQSGIASLAALFTPPVTEAATQKFLRVQLCAETAALVAVNEIVGAIHVSVMEVLPVPHMPECVLGLYNWRGDILWFVDLASQVGLTPLFDQGRSQLTCMAIVAQVNGQSLGFVVPDVQEIEQHDPDQLQSPIAGFVPPKLLPFVKGYLASDRSIVLDIAALLQDPHLQVHPFS